MPKITCKNRRKPRKLQSVQLHFPTKIKNEFLAVTKETLYR